MTRFVAVEGLIGAGKTSLCRVLAEAWGARLVLEPALENPFLEPFYVDPARYALPTQLYYLMARWQQQAQIRQPELFSQAVVSDYLFAKDRIFAEKTLDDQGLELYERFTSVLDDEVPVPDLVILLDAPTDVLLRRVARRGMAGEHAITAFYLDDLRNRYRRWFRTWRASPVLHIDTTRTNYVDDPQARQEIVRYIEAALERRDEPTAPGSISDREAQAALFGMGSSR